MIEAGERARLGDHPLVCSAIALAPGVKDLECDLAVQIGIICSVDDAHAAVGPIASQDVASEPGWLRDTEQRLLGTGTRGRHADAVYGRARDRKLHGGCPGPIVYPLRHSLPA
jgi:hypothetical protein